MLSAIRPRLGGHLLDHLRFRVSIIILPVAQYVLHYQFLIRTDSLPPCMMATIRTLCVYSCLQLTDDMVTQVPESRVVMC
jgi:hypothetical protein